MYFLGIDPGLSEVGFGVIKVVDGEPSFVDCGIIKTKPSDTFADRLSIIKKDIVQILNMHSYRAAGIEELFFAKNVTNALKVAQARGIILEAINSHNISIEEFKPTEVKINICGDGSADKKMIQIMIQRLLKLNQLPKPHDAADALAIAILTSRTYKK